MNCRDSESLILAERDGALTKDQLAALSDHAAACPACLRLRRDLTAAVDAYQTGLAAVTAPDADTAWRELQSRLNRPARKRTTAPVIWFGTSLAAALALAFFAVRPTPPAPTGAIALTSPPPYDPSIIAGADFVEAGDPNASTLVYVDKESGWLVVWATDGNKKTNG